MFNDMLAPFRMTRFPLEGFADRMLRMFNEMERGLQTRFEKGYETDWDNGLIAGLPFPELPKLVAAPRLGVREEEKAYVVEVEVPGYKAEEIEIAACGRTLTIQGARREEVGEEAPEGGEKAPKGEPEKPAAKQWVRRELTAAEFAETVALPFEVRPEAVAAELARGMLTVRIAKPEEVKAAKIAITNRAGEIPKAEAPVAEAPVTEAPVTEAPVTEAPVAEAPKCVCG
jgi:HSP20 family protein